MNKELELTKAEEVEINSCLIALMFNDVETQKTEISKLSEKLFNCLIEVKPSLLGTCHCTKAVVMKMLKDNIYYSHYIYTNPNIDREVYQFCLDKFLSDVEDENNEDALWNLEDFCRKINDSEFTKNILVQFLTFLKKHHNGDFDDVLSECYCSLVNNPNVSHTVLEIYNENAKKMEKNADASDFYTIFLANAY